jgi:hypothetical protein
MTLAALQHLLRAASALAEDRRFLVLGSASLLASHPELGGPDAPLASTFDADLAPRPFDELTGTMLEQALGESHAYHLRHGYHADILRESIFETLPLGWENRLIPVPDCPTAHALEPHDLAAVKLLVARPKDLRLVGQLLAQGLLDPEVLRQRIDLLPIPIEVQPRVLANFRHLITS